MASLKPPDLRTGGGVCPEEMGREETGSDRRTATHHLACLSCLPVFPSQLQVHMVLQLCPVLGDHRYSARVGAVLGQRFLLPAESTKPQRQVPKAFCPLPPGAGPGDEGGQHLQTLPVQLRTGRQSSRLPRLSVTLFCCMALSSDTPLLHLILPICSIREFN